MSPALFFGMIAGVTAITAEYLYARWTLPWVAGIWLWTPLQLLIGYCVYRMVTIPGLSLLDAFIVFAFCTATLRIFVSIVLLDQTVRTGTWVAYGLIIAAQFARTYWR